MTLKELKKLVAYCRSAGISNYKTSEVEFALTAYDPKTEKKTAKKLEKVEKTVEEKLAAMTDEEILLYSSATFTDKEV